jgi:hypothetical protein
MSGGRKTDGGRAPVEAPKVKARGHDDCDLSFEVDLSATRPALRQVVDGAVLDVELAVQGNLETVICKRQAVGDVVGSLAAFEGLAKLMDCIRRGNRYVADVNRVVGANCSVRVRRVGK